MPNISQLLVEETDGACAYCGIKDFRVLTEHHIVQTNPKDQSYDNRIILCHNCHHLYHQNKGPSKEDIEKIKKRLISKTLTQQGINIIKESSRKGGVVAAPHLVNHLVELGYIQLTQVLSTVGHDENDEDDDLGNSIISDAVYELTEDGKMFAQKWGFT